jgi:galactokinase
MTMHPREFVLQTYQQRFGRKPACLAFAPGRVNLLGEHVDYNDGFVLPAAIDRATWIAFSPARSGQSTIIAADFNEETTFTREVIGTKTSLQGNPLPEWARYPAGVAWSFGKANLSVPMIEAVYASDVPRGAGLSSSASVEMAFATAWDALGGWSLPPMRRAQLGRQAEVRYVGLNCGIMDQFASACGVADKLLLLDCRSLEWQELPIPGDVSIVIADTSIRRKLTGEGYNERHGQCEEALRILSSSLPGIQALRDVSLADFNRLSGKLPPLIEKRARHVVEEIERTRQAAPLLERGDVRAFGALMNACHTSLRDLYEVSTPELDAMAEFAHNLPGCFGARLTGAGFGGCTVNLVEKGAAEKFAAKLGRIYQEWTGLTPEIYICRASDGAQLVG